MRHIVFLNGGLLVAAVIVCVGHNSYPDNRGETFQRAFKTLGGLQALTSAPFLALTASATPHIEAEIHSTLELREPVLIKLPLDRPNIFQCTSKKTSINVSACMSNTGSETVSSCILLYAARPRQYCH